MSWSMAVVQWEVALVDFTLRADFAFKLGVFGIHCLRAGMGLDVQGFYTPYHL